MASELRKMTVLNVSPTMISADLRRPPWDIAQPQLHEHRLAHIEPDEIEHDQADQGEEDVHEIGE